MTFTLRALSPAIGVEAIGIDISRPVDAETAAALRRAWQFDGSGLLIVRDQNLDKDQQRAFCGLFGTIGARAGSLPTKRPRAHEGPDYNSDAMLVSNIRENGRPIGVLPDGELWFHHDMCYSATPNRASFLYSIETPSVGGDTMFCNMYEAYERLPARLKQAIEGRRVLLFSQFTEMLALIARELNRRHLHYVTLTGDTRDHAEPVRKFQDGEVPLFLLSLKAGGVGLNLTAADTVIHYDPWWNPAAETQAADRAHRIGQDKPVFVYRLICADTVEERIEPCHVQCVDELFGEHRTVAAGVGDEDFERLVGVGHGRLGHWL